MALTSSYMFTFVIAVCCFVVCSDCRDVDVHVDLGDFNFPVDHLPYYTRNYNAYSKSAFKKAEEVCYDKDSCDVSNFY